MSALRPAVLLGVAFVNSSTGVTRYVHRVYHVNTPAYPVYGFSSVTAPCRKSQTWQKTSQSQGGRGGVATEVWRGQSNFRPTTEDKPLVCSGSRLSTKCKGTYVATFNQAPLSLSSSSSVAHYRDRCTPSHKTHMIDKYDPLPSSPIKNETRKRQNI